MKTKYSNEQRLLAAIDRLAPPGWTGIDWIHTNDTAIAIAREKAGLPGHTRERARQVRAIIAQALKSQPGRPEIGLLREIVEVHIQAEGLDEKKAAELRDGIVDLRPLDWHKAVTNPPSAQRILALPREKVLTMTAAQVAKEVDCLEPWAAQVMRKAGIPFIDISETAGTRYPWTNIAPIEWFFLSDAEIGEKVGCANVSVVAQYRERHGKINKYNNPALTLVRRYFMDLAPAERLRLVRKFLAGSLDLSCKRPMKLKLASKECKDQRNKLEKAKVMFRTSLESFRLAQARVKEVKATDRRLQREPHVTGKILHASAKRVKAAKRRLKAASHKLDLGMERLKARKATLKSARLALPNAMKEVLDVVRATFPGLKEDDWFPTAPSPKNGSAVEGSVKSQEPEKVAVDQPVDVSSSSGSSS